MYLLDCLLEWISCGLISKNVYTKILVVGLKNSGKSTLLRQLAAIPTSTLTHHGTTEVLNAKPGHFIAMDLGAGQPLRPSLTDYLLRACGLRSPQTHPFLSDYLAGTTGVMFFVDAADHERLDEARAEFQALLSMDEMFRVPLVVLGNKTDVPGAVSPGELRYRLGLRPTANDRAPVLYRGMGSRPGAGRPLKVFMASVGLGFEMRYIEWLINRVKERSLRHVGSRHLPRAAVAD